MTPSDLITSRLLPILSALADHLDASRNLTRAMFEPANVLQWEEIVTAERAMRRLACDALDAVRPAIYSDLYVKISTRRERKAAWDRASDQMTLIRVGATEDEIRRWAREWKERAEAWEVGEAA